MPYSILIYLLICLLVGLATRNKVVGFWGGLLMSILFTPLLVALGLILLGAKDKN